jgi:uncharacterized protein YbjT (DUF2867 family)
MMAAASIAKDDTIRLPFASGRTSPIAARDVARVVATILENPAAHVGKVYELTGHRSMGMNEIAKEYEEALGRSIKYVDIPFDKWQAEELLPVGLPEHVFHHFSVMAQLHAQNRYDRLTADVQTVTGKSSMSVREYVASRPDLFKKSH